LKHIAVCQRLLLACCVVPVALASAQTQFPGRYVLASAVLPGAGELWMGSRTKGEVFLWTDAGIWLTHGGLSLVGNARNQDAKLYARRYSGASASWVGDDYYVAVERYDNSDQYNEDIRRDARQMYPDDPENQKRYYETHGIFDTGAWNWNGADSLRLAYWDRRKAARNLTHTAGFFLGAALLNRLASAVDVAFFTKPQRDHSSLLFERRLTVAPLPDQPGLGLYFRF
jgi:hypothetical protein